MSVYISALGGAAAQFFDNSGNLLTGGLIYTYAAGTTTPQATYTSSAGATAHTNPIVLDSAGRVNEIWLTENLGYKFVIYTSTGVLVGSYDNIVGINDPSAANTALTAFQTLLAGPTGSSLVGFKQAAANSVTTTVQAKLRQYVNISDFGAAGDGVTDDTTPMINFFNSAINNPGVPHRLNKATYCISQVMPTINVSNVIIEGEGADLHDIGTLMTGTVIKWIAPGSTASTMVTISSVSNASGQRISDVKFTGIGLDCNSGSIYYGLKLISIRDSQIDVAIANASFCGMAIEVVASLGEAKDVQRCQIRLIARQIEAPNGFCLVCGGDSTANTSLNEFWVDAQIKNIQGIYLINTDNNDWNFIRLFRAAGGTVTEGVSCLGGSTVGERCRGERFWYYTSTVPIHVYGTSSTPPSPSYTYGSVGHSLFCLDTENGTPAPIVETGGSINWRKDTSAMSDNPWISYTPTITASSGTITTITNIAASYIQRGVIVYIKIQFNVTNNGTGSGSILVTTPIAQVGNLGTVLSGVERQTSGKMLYGFLDGGGTSTISIKDYTGAYPVSAAPATITISGFYQVT
jgi:hypothetical protein